MNFTDYITPEIFILVPVLYGLGMVLQETVVSNKWIPLINTVVAILIVGLYVFSVKPMNTSQEIAQAVFTSLTQGILIASASVYTNETIKQMTKK